MIDESLSPLLARHLRTAHGFDAVHVHKLGLRGALDADFLARAIAEDRIIVTSNADDFRKLGARTPAHPGLAVMLDAVGRAQQLTLGVGLANAIDSRNGGWPPARDRPHGRRAELQAALIFMSAPCPVTG